MREAGRRAQAENKVLLISNISVVDSVTMNKTTLHFWHHYAISLCRMTLYCVFFFVFCFFLFEYEVNKFYLWPKPEIIITPLLPLPITPRNRVFGQNTEV